MCHSFLKTIYVWILALAFSKRPPRRFSFEQLIRVSIINITRFHKFSEISKLSNFFELMNFLGVAIWISLWHNSFRKNHIEISSFHEPQQSVCSSEFSVWNMHCIHCIEMASFFHDICIIKSLSSHFEVGV